LEERVAGGRARRAGETLKLAADGRKGEHVWSAEAEKGIGRRIRR
jgi:hypothetical protein